MTKLWALSVCVCFFSGVKAKVGSGPFVKGATQFPLILWHPYARHHYFCVLTEKEQTKWHAVLQDCVRHSNNGEELCEHMTQLTHTVHTHSHLVVLNDRKGMTGREQQTLPQLHPGQLLLFCFTAIVHNTDQGVCVSLCERLHTISMSCSISESEMQPGRNVF